MKHYFWSLLLISVLTSCGVSTPLLKNSAVYSRGASSMIVTPLQADLQILSEKRISYYLEVNESVRAGGIDNVIATAVKEALDVHGGDVIVGLETQVKYDKKGQIESICIDGFPAKYVNFRPAKDIPTVSTTTSEDKTGARVSLLGKKK